MFIRHKPKEAVQNKGAAVVEFALVLPLLLMIIFGIIEFGRLFWVKQILTYAAREGGRAAIIPGATNTSVQTAIDNAMSGSGLTAYTIQRTPNDVSTASGGASITIKVSISYNDVTLIPGFLSALVGQNLIGQVVMRKEGFT